MLTMATLEEPTAGERECLRDLGRQVAQAASLVLKDATSFIGEPSRAARWVEMARRVVECP
jgi:hypothetical protein